MLKYLPASFLYTSQVTESEQAELENFYIPYVLENSDKESEDASNVRTDFFDQSVEPWPLFVNIMFHKYCDFVRECLLSSGTYHVRIKPWFNYYATGNAMNFHSHPETDFGIVYCLKNAGRKHTQFHTFSHEYMTMTSRYPKIETCREEWDPSPGEYVFFPGSLFHATEVAEVDGERITLIANVIMRKEKESDNLSLRLDQSVSG